MKIELKSVKIGRVQKYFLALFFILLLLIFPNSIFAADSTNIPNNKFGIHILFPTELEDAAKLVNSSGGDWGYVTIPIQSNDKDLNKWQKFMDDAKRLHLIPIIRLATNGDYYNAKVWEKPNDENIVDFANFLNSLNWPVKNRYIVVYNEVNRGNEWGGSPNPGEYAQILQYAVTSFKGRSSDFFILSAGMDNAAANTSDAMNEYDFMRQMDIAVPGVFNQIDGIASHSYPNPGFSQPPTIVSDRSIYSFKSEDELAESLSNKTLPVFITETGWSAAVLPDSVIAPYYKIAFESVWSDPNIMAVTPFLLIAGTDPFKQFSIMDTAGGEFLRYKTIFDYPKVKGLPILNEVKNVLGYQIPKIVIPVKNFSGIGQNESSFNKEAMQTIYSWLLKL